VKITFEMCLKNLNHYERCLKAIKLTLPTTYQARYGEFNLFIMRETGRLRFGALSGESATSLLPPEEQI
jgi:hypothetical protein